MLVIQIDLLNPQSLQTRLACLLHIFPIPSHYRLPLRIPQIPKLARQEDLLPPARVFEPFPDQLLVGVRAIDVRGIPEVDPEVRSAGQDVGGGLVVVAPEGGVLDFVSRMSTNSSKGCGAGQLGLTAKLIPIHPRPVAETRSSPILR